MAGHRATAVRFIPTELLVLLGDPLHLVMSGRGAAIHVLSRRVKTWMAGTSPAMTMKNRQSSTGLKPDSSGRRAGHLVPRIAARVGQPEGSPCRRSGSRREDFGD